MNAMILAAGRGERMRPLTDRCPKPLLEAGGKPLIVWHLERLRAAGFSRVVINHAHLGEMLEGALGNGDRWGLEIAYSAEGVALETAGGIAFALPLLGDAPFLVVNGDIWCDFDFGVAPRMASLVAGGAIDACCVLVPNPAHNPGGDFALAASGEIAPPFARLRCDGGPSLTFSGIAVYAPRLVHGVQRGTRAPLAPLLRLAAERGRAAGLRHDGRWVDVGTPQRLAELDAQLRREN